MSAPETRTPDGGTGVVVEHTDGVMTLTLDRPHRKNALTSEMVAAIAESVRAASADDTTRVILIRGTGADFCSGIDLVQSNDGSAEPSKPRTGHLQRRLSTGAHDMILAIDAAQVPIVAAVRGWAAGVGNMLALSADVVIADTTARFWVPFVTKGFTPDSGNTWLLPRLVGLARAKEMVLRGTPSRRRGPRPGGSSAGASLPASSTPRSPRWSTNCGPGRPSRSGSPVSSCTRT